MKPNMDAARECAVKLNKHGQVRPFRRYVLQDCRCKDEDRFTRAGPIVRCSPAEQAGLKPYDIIINAELLETALVAACDLQKLDCINPHRQVRAVASRLGEGLFL